MEKNLKCPSKRFKKDEETEIDRLSSLPNPIIHRILSLIDTKTAVQTCVLSKQWRSHWIHIDKLSFDAKSFSGWKDFRKFVLTVLEKREHYDLCSLRLFCGSKRDLHVINRTLDYAKSHNVAELEIDTPAFPLCHFLCETLKTLKLGPGVFRAIPIPFDFSGLTTLQLVGINLYHQCYGYEIFSGCFNLENLLIIGCNLSMKWILQIDTPRLVNLIISNLEFRHALVLDAPRLKYLYYSGTCPTWVVDNYPALEKVNIVASELRNISNMIHLAEKVSHAKTIEMSFEACDGEKFVATRNSRGRIRFVRRYDPKPGFLRYGKEIVARFLQSQASPVV